MNENTLRPLLWPNGTPMSGLEIFEFHAKRLPQEWQIDTTDATVLNSTEKPLSLDEEKVSETDEKIDSTETIFSSAEDTKNLSENTASSVDIPVVPMEETDVPMWRNPFQSLEQVAPLEWTYPVSPGENSGVMNEKSDTPESEKSSNAEDEKNVSGGHVISTSPVITFATNIPNDHRPLSKFEEGFAKTLPIEDFPWESRKKTVSDVNEWNVEWISADTKDFLDSERDSDIASPDTEMDSDIIPSEADYSEVPVSRWESLERWARFVGRNEDGIIILQKAPFWADIKDSEIYSTEAIRDSWVDIYLLADLLKESDIGKVRKMVREVSKMRGVDFVFRHTKEVKNATGRLLTSREEATISGSTIGYVTLEGFFETLAYALAKSSKMTE